MEVDDGEGQIPQKSVRRKENKIVDEVLEFLDRMDKDPNMNDSIESEQLASGSSGNGSEDQSPITVVPFQEPEPRDQLRSTEISGRSLRQTAAGDTLGATGVWGIDLSLIHI